MYNKPIAQNVISSVSICICLLLLCFSISHAADNTFIKNITAPEVKEMLSKDKVVLINSLTNIEYTIQHIPDSINIPFHEMDNNPQLPEDKTKTLIFYCMGQRCLYSKKASIKAMQLGYTNVYWFEGGIPDWYRFNYPMNINKQLKSIRVKKISPAKVYELINKDDIIVIDIKPQWWNSSAGKIKNSIYLPLVKLQHTYHTIPQDKPIIISDGLMRQSPSAARFLISKGYNVLGVLKGGLTRWEKEGFPVIKH
ncbi:MAG: rhodanese-like domain-containing protein [Gammaproteobacteria bacterium]|nr:rhodanese-like domain-containing protein [Gammaproteobacteria bacterium]